MDAQTVEGEALSYVLMKPQGFRPDDGYPLVILLHGFGAAMFDLAGLASAIDDKGYVYAFPNGPYRVNIGPGIVGYSWAVNRDGVEPPPSGSPGMEQLLDGFVAEVTQETGATTGRIVLGGFSQGGGMTLTYGLPRPDTFAGLAVLSGAFRDAGEVAKRLPPQRDQRIFITHGAYDPLISLERSRGTKSFLEELGYSPAYKEYDMAHEISLPVIRDLIPWLHETLPPHS